MPTIEVCALTAPGALNSAAGSLYVVATPIGNLDDISARALKILREVALIAAEDTRHSQRLMQHFGIATPLAACHEHNERDEGSRFIARLLAGDDVALISDAGTPLISDPGYHLVRQARAAGINVVPVPGACALIAALSAAGLPSDRFIFEGFLPAKAVGRRARLEVGQGGAAYVDILRGAAPYPRMSAGHGTGVRWRASGVVGA